MMYTISKVTMVWCMSQESVMMRVYNHIIDWLILKILLLSAAKKPEDTVPESCELNPRAPLTHSFTKRSVRHTPGLFPVREA